MTSNEQFNTEYDAYGNIRTAPKPVIQDSASGLVSNPITEGTSPTVITDGQFNSDMDMVEGHLQSSNFETGVRGWQINSDGDAEFASGKFRGNITGASGTFSGAISAISGSIGGFTITDGYILGTNATLNSNGEFIFGPTDGQYLKITPYGGIGLDTAQIEFNTSTDDTAILYQNNTDGSLYLENANLNIEGDILPGNTNQYNLGSSSKKWKDVYVQSLVVAGTITIPGAVNGGVLYSDANYLRVSAAGTSGKLLQSNGAAAPTWVTPSSPRFAGLNTAWTQAADDTEQNVLVTTIPANTLGNNGIIRLTIYGTAQTGNPSTLKVHFNDSYTQIGYAFAGGETFCIRGEIANRNAANSQFTSYTIVKSSTPTAVEGTDYTNSIDTSVSQTLTVTFQSDSGGSQNGKINLILIEIIK